MGRRGPSLREDEGLALQEITPLTRRAPGWWGPIGEPGLLASSWRQVGILGLTWAATPPAVRSLGRAGLIIFGGLGPVCLIDQIDEAKTRGLGFQCAPMGGREFAAQWRRHINHALVSDEDQLGNGYCILALFVFAWTSIKGGGWVVQQRAEQQPEKATI